MPTLSIRLLSGPPVFLLDGKQLKFPANKTVALLIYLVCCEGRHERETLAALLWPDSKTPLHSLSVALSSIKKVLEKAGTNEDILAGLEKSHEYIEFDFGKCNICDVKEFERLTETEVLSMANLSKLEHATGLYQEKFLQSFYVRNSHSDFDTWIVSMHSRLESRYQKLLCTLSICYMAQSKWKDAIRHLEHLLKNEDVEEEMIYGLLMICYAVIGDPKAAAEIYQLYEKLMNGSFNQSPDISMIRLRDAIKRTQFSDRQVEGLATSLVKKLSQNTTNNPPLNKIFSELLEELRVKKVLRESSEYRSVLTCANEKAAEKGFRLVGIPHLFLAFCVEKGFLGYIYNKMWVDFDQLAKDMTYVVGEEDANSSTFPIGYTLAVQDVRQRAIELAREHKADSIDLQHLWVALLEREDSLLTKLLDHHDHDRNDWLRIAINHL